MDIEFWNRAWQKNEIGFHARKPNPLLVAHFNELNLKVESRVFLPLCGKTLDIAWLLSKGYRVAGAELSGLAIEQMFTELEEEPNISSCGKILRYSGTNIDIFVGDIFELSSDDLGQVDAVYDRAALVALPAEMRTRYTEHLLEITGRAKQLLITFEYDQSQMDGPPFSISRDEIHRYYQDTYNLVRLESISVPGGLKGAVAATENIWHLKNDF